MRDGIRFLRQCFVRMGSEPIAQLLPHAWIHVQETQSGLAVSAAPRHFRIAFDLNIAVGKVEREVCFGSLRERLSGEDIKTSAAYVQENSLDVLGFFRTEKDGSLNWNPERLPPFPLQHRGRRSQSGLRLLMGDRLDQD